jgi:hypothetical protein
MPLDFDYRGSFFLHRWSFKANLEPDGLPGLFKGLGLTVLIGLWGLALVLWKRLAELPAGGEVRHAEGLFLPSALSSAVRFRLGVPSD